MNRFALALQLWALTFLITLTTNSPLQSNTVLKNLAFPATLDLSFGGRFSKRDNPVSNTRLREYEALSNPAAASFSNAMRSDDYIADVSHDGVYTWEADKLPIKIFVSAGAGVPGFRPQFGTYIRTSFDAWAQASGNKLSWVEVTDPTKADITVYWTDKVYERPEGTEAGKTAALTRLNTATGRGTIYGARMQMLTRLPGREFGDAEVAKTCLHEAGHAFGLQGHSHQRGDIMFYAVSPSQEFALTTRDKATMAHLYANFPVQSGIAVGPKLQAPAN